MDKETYIATTRFGLGASGDFPSISNPKNWLLAQIQQREQNLQDFSNITSSKQNLGILMEANYSARLKGLKGDDLKAETAGVKKIYGKYFMAEMEAKINHAISTTTPFYERLVDFWSNHFSINRKKSSLVGGITVAYEREAIRPYVTGKFVDILMAVEKHPAMLIYLDNANSIGPNSKAGSRSNKGLNENLAREILELHTVGVNGGYTQADVTSFAKVITGWTVARPEKFAHEEVGSFTFLEKQHEGGAQVVMGKNYADGGIAQGEAVLRDLAVHPSTAKFISYKLARHFIADNPPQSAVDALAAEFEKTGGDLKAVYTVLLNLPDAWSMSSPKIKSNYHLVVSAARLVGGDVLPAKWCFVALKFLGDAPFSAPSPAGFSDITSDMAGPENLLRRVEFSRHAGGNRRLKGKDAMKLADLAIGPIMGNATRSAIASAVNEDLAFSLLFGSPEFQRR